MLYTHLGLEYQGYIFTKLNARIKISLETGLNQMIREFTSTDMDQVLSIWLDASVQAHDFVDRYFWESKLDDMRDVYIPGSETFVYDDEGTITRR
ncbi:MAG: hypothetical protein WD037_10590 [Balneolales bacterium]